MCIGDGRGGGMGICTWIGGGMGECGVVWKVGYGGSVECMWSEIFVCYGCGDHRDLHRVDGRQRQRCISGCPWLQVQQAGEGDAGQDRRG